MPLFAYSSPRSAAEAASRGAHLPGAAFIAGGTDLIQLAQEHVAVPREVVDINALPFRGIADDGGGLRIGALEKMSDVADHPVVRRDFPVVAEALLASASPQVRNLATIGGNLLQRTRCLYFRDAAMPCNKRQPGSGCGAWDGENRMNAILGGGPACIAAHASDLAVALVALGARLRLEGEAGERTLPLAELYLLPGDTPERETVLRPGELITEVILPEPAPRSHYLKVRDRASFEWALTSAAVALDLEGDIVRRARVAAGGVGTKPWRLPQVEAALVGKKAEEGVFAAAASRAAEGAAPREGNRFKGELVTRTVMRALAAAGGRA